MLLGVGQRFLGSEAPAALIVVEARLDSLPLRCLRVQCLLTRCPSLGAGRSDRGLPGLALLVPPQELVCLSIAYAEAFFGLSLRRATLLWNRLSNQFVRDGGFG